MNIHFVCVGYHEEWPLVMVIGGSYRNGKVEVLPLTTEVNYGVQMQDFPISVKFAYGGLIMPPGMYTLYHVIHVS